MIKSSKGCYRNFVTVLVVFLLTVGPTVFGAEDQRVLTSAQKQLQEKVTFTCRDLPVDTVLMQLAEQAKVDIIKSPKVKGNITVKVTDVPLEEALNNILAAHGWTYVATENMIRVVPLTEIGAVEDKLATSIYQITYANVEDVAKALNSYISEKGKIAFNKGTNHIIVTDMEQKIKAIDRFIAQIDRQTPQVMVEARIYDITTTEGFEIGVEWQASRNTPLTTITDTTDMTRTDTTTSPTDVTTVTEGETFDETQNPPIGTEENPAKYEETVRETETGGTSYVISDERTISTEDTSWLRDLEGDLVPVRRSKPFIGSTFDKDSGGYIQFGLLNDMIDLDIALRMLSKQVEAKLLANPRVLVLDNETANIKIVTEIPYSESVQTAAISGLVIARIQFKDVGVLLQVTPHVAREGMIRLKLKPEFGVQAGPQELNTGFALEAPAVNTRTLETIALVKDGQTVVMGGLRKQETSTDISKVPVLGDIPLLGDLFRYETENKEINELVVFITPKIVSTDALTELEERQFQATEIPSPGMSKADKNKQIDVDNKDVDVVAVESDESVNKG